MELTRRCDYACRILRSAYRHRDIYISIGDVAEEEDIPYAFARTIQHDLAMVGYLKTIRGARGGLSLAIDPEQVTVLDVLCALQGPVSIAPCSADSSTCAKSCNCSFNRVWAVADKMLNALFGSLTLAEIFESEKGTDRLAGLDERMTAAVSSGVKEIMAESRR